MVKAVVKWTLLKTIYILYKRTGLTDYQVIENIYQLHLQINVVQSKV